MVSALVTGGCGFIGSNFIRHLLLADKDVRVINLDNLTYAGNPRNLADLDGHPRLEFVKGDIADGGVVRQVLSRGVKSILNFAAESHVDRSIRDCAPFLRTNVVGTQVLLDAAREFKVERFVQISTDEVYGSLGPTGRFTEESPPAPRNPYAASKAAADLLALSYANTYSLPVVIARCCNNYGPYQFPEKVIPRFISSLLRDEPVPLYGDGLHVRDWLHVRDNCAALQRIWREGRLGEVYNVGGGCEVTNLQLTQLLLDILGKPRALIAHVADRPGHDRRYALDWSKIERELGWRPIIPFAEGLRETVRWYQEHPDWTVQIEKHKVRESATTHLARRAAPASRAP
jgi:dTDP-glucose 4,6-dehydratase